MKFKLKNTSYSIDYIIKVLFIFLFPVVLLDIIISSYITYSMRNQTVQSLQDSTALYISQIDTAHISINKYLIRRLTADKNFLTALETEDSLELITAFDKVHSDVDTFMESFDKGYQIFIYNERNGRFLRPTEILSFLEKEDLDDLTDSLIDCILRDEHTGAYSDAWQILTVDSGVYFFKIFKSGSNYAGCFISAEDIIKPLKKINLGKDGFISLASGDGATLTNHDKMEERGIPFSEEDINDFTEVRTYGSNIIISGALTIGTFYPRIILNKFSAYERIMMIQFIMFGTILIIAAILFSSMIYMKRRVLTPIKQFSEGLSHFNDSTEIIDLKDTRFLELEQANLQFKNLMRQIKKLKIDIYEKELEKQKTLMNYLQLQIRPHFFLNCLNTIYSMAQTQLYDEIMEMSIITSNYFRYIFQNPHDFVPLKYELSHIENYMKIQKLRYGDGFTYEIFSEEATGDIRILPILIQTFIENSIKHSAALDEPITIRTEAVWMGSQDNPHENVQIQITDTGNGFPPDVLKELNSTQALTPVDGHRIGITNAIKRLRLFYKEEEAAITFSNLPAGGACVTILLPAYTYQNS